MQSFNDQIRFLDIFLKSFTDGSLIKMTLSKPLKKSDIPENIYLRPVNIKNQLLISIIYRYKTKDITKNYPVTETQEILNKCLGNDFSDAVIFTTQQDIQLKYNKKRIPKLLFSKPTQSPLQELSHDRHKMRVIDIKGKDYLQKLGVINSGYEVIPKMQDKYRQINKYIELVDTMIEPESSSDTFQVTDMGSGKGYLTFALYDHLTNNKKMNTKITGVEMRGELVHQCNQIAKDEGFENLQFVSSTIQDFDAKGTRMLIALHACDTATDDAIFKALQAEAKYIIVAPCCHKQVRKSMQVPQNLKPILRHGIFLERQAELVTDAIRALIMEKFGYQTKVFEFISTEHTPKNIMIFGIKNNKKVNKTIISDQIHQIKSFYGIENHYLEDLLAGY
ncbi:MAG TPA: SAM-dependent methyltransferase [Bacteroidales bacterium]|nr:SAM-dependent methyltransferase [Bacteroidales bacterium]HPR57264.1 SAM-dependent methyltransferase [Bacteroidales bacterium]HRW96169.1 SAM-dependent methyltransferase [Bacteroidales bacterium]